MSLQQLNSPLAHSCSESSMWPAIGIRSTLGYHMLGLTRAMLQIFNSKLPLFSRHLVLAALEGSESKSQSKSLAISLCPGQLVVPGTFF